MNTRRMIALFCCMGALALAGRAHAYGVPTMVRDINPGTNSSNPQKLFAIGNKLFFGATNGSTGIEPMASNGTEAGTILLQDINPGALSGFVVGCIDCNAIPVGNLAYFTATNGASGSKLWRTDGTVAGTAIVYSGANVGDLTNVGGQIFMSGVPNGGSLGFLYKCDGTGAGTAQVSGSVLPSAFGMTALNGNAYFSGDNFSSGAELFRSDGTDAGTILVKNLAVNGNSYPTLLTKVGNRL